MALTKAKASVIDITDIGTALSNEGENSPMRQYIDSIKAEQDAQIATLTTTVNTTDGKVDAATTRLDNLPQVTVSTENPSGGKDGDVWYKVL